MVLYSQFSYKIQNRKADATPPPSGFNLNAKTELFY